MTADPDSIHEVAMKPVYYVGMALLCMASLGFAGHAQAQNPRIYRPGAGAISRPALSPYLNLLRGGSPAANYYLGVRPERERRAADAALWQLEDLLGRPPVPARPDTPEPALPRSGHPTYFLNYSHYYGSGIPQVGSSSGRPLRGQVR